MGVSFLLLISSVSVPFIQTLLNGPMTPGGASFSLVLHVMMRSRVSVLPITDAGVELQDYLWCRYKQLEVNKRTMYSTKLSSYNI